MATILTTGFANIVGVPVLGAISGGEWLALGLAAVCLFQRLLYHGNKRQLLEKHENQVDSLQRELVGIDVENRLSRMETQLLRSVCEADQPTIAFDNLFRRYVANSKAGFAFYVNCGSNPKGEIVRSRGLSQAVPCEFPLGAELLKQITQDGYVKLGINEIGDSFPYAKLHAQDRAKVQTLHFFSVFVSQANHGVVVTSSLPYPTFAAEEQVAIISRVLKAFRRLWGEQESIRQDAQKLKTTNDILALRQIVDQPFDSASQMFGQLMERLKTLVSVDRCALYLCLPAKPGAFRLLARSEEKLQSNLNSFWVAQEETLIADTMAQGKSLTVYSEDRMQDLGVQSLMRGAVIARIENEGQVFGAVCLTNRDSRPFSSSQLESIEHVRQFLAETTLRLSSQASIQKQVQEDALTGLKNRRWFDQQMDREMRQAHAIDRPCSLLLIDLDRFKSVNDNYGHQMGDQVLKDVAQVLQNQMATLRDGDRGFAARYGGEELAILLPGVPFNGARRIAEMVRKAIENTPVSYADETISVTASIGVASFPNHAASVAEMIRVADEGLYAAKEGGRNRVSTPDDLLSLV